MPNFSQRYGYTPIEKAFQRERVDESLRTSLWNVLGFVIWDTWEAVGLYNLPTAATKRIEELVERLWFHFFKLDMDRLPPFRPPHGSGAYEVIKQRFFTFKWFEVYDFIEFLANDSSSYIDDQARGYLNKILESENSAYRLVGPRIVEITSTHEIKAIEEGLSDPEKAARTHMETALSMLSDKQKPDYRNSIKESISAVEAACRIFTGNEKATLGDALKVIPDLHPALNKGFGAIYGYTSDASGIRHSLIEESNIKYEDAKFMLVACAGFLSYLRSKFTGPGSSTGTPSSK